MRIGTVAAIFLGGVVSGVLVAAQAQPSPGERAERVTGIGGVFLKARDPKALSVWYRDKLGVGVREGATFAPFLWREREDSSRIGTTVWSLFRSDTTYFAPSEATCMVNYRVRNLEAMLAQLGAAGVRVEGKLVEDFNGKFAWVLDPEGNKIELWEPKAGY